MKIIFSLLLIASFHTILAQTSLFTISGNIKEGDSPIEAATVTLLKAADSSWVRSEYTDDKGTFKLEGIAKGAYVVNVFAAGYIAKMEPLSVDSNKNIEITIKKQDNSLKEITVTTIKPFVEMDMGKTVINVENSVTAAGNNVLDLLRKSPGVSVDINGNVSMAGKQGVLILINDRPTYLDGDQLAEYLKSLQADEIAQLELMTQPNAKYDAAGNAGIINIKTKKNRKAGFNGTLSLTHTQGIYPFSTGDLQLHYKKNKLNLSFNGSHHEGQAFAYWTEKDEYKDALGNIAQTTYMTSQPQEYFTNTNAKIAADYEFSPRLTAGASIDGTYHTNVSSDEVNTTTFDRTTGDTIYIKQYRPDGHIRHYITANAYLDKKMGKDGDLTVNADYVTYTKDLHQNITTAQYDTQSQPLPDPLISRSAHPTMIDVYSLRADYSNTIAHGIKLEAGYKSSYVINDNNAIFDIYQNGAWAPDPSRTNHFIYKENINALYANGNKKFNDKWQAQAGLRAENTNADGLLKTTGQHFTHSYISLFPTAYLAYTSDKNNRFELNYGRRIDRPEYQMLNPFVYYGYQYNYYQGNPYLQPQFTHNVELKHTYKNVLTTTVSYSNTRNEICYVLQTDTAGVLHATDKNLASSQTVDVSVNFNKEIFKWWRTNINADASFITYTGFVGNEFVSRAGSGYHFTMNNQLILGDDDWKAECEIAYSGRGITTITGIQEPVTYIGLGISKKITADSTLKVTVADPFNIYQLHFYDTSATFNSATFFRNNSQAVTFAFSYNFGKSSSSQRERSAVDETRRIGM